MEPDFQIFIFQTQISVCFGPGDAWACPTIYRIIFKSENVEQTISDPGQKLIVYTLPWIWQYPLFQNGYKYRYFIKTGKSKKIVLLLYCIVYPFRLETLVPIVCGIIGGGGGTG